MERAGQSKCRKFGDLILKTVIYSEGIKNKKYPEILKENVWEFAWDRGWEGIAQRKIPILSLLNFQFLKTLLVPQFSILNPQIFGTY